MLWPSTSATCRIPLALSTHWLRKRRPAIYRSAKRSDCKRQKCAGRIDKMNHRHMIFDGDVGRADHFFHGEREPGAAFDGTVAGHYQHLAPVHQADSGNQPGTGHSAVIGFIGRQGGKLQKWGVFIQQQIDAFMHQQFVLPSQAVDIPFGALITRFALTRVKIGRKFDGCAVHKSGKLMTEDRWWIECGACQASSSGHKVTRIASFSNDSPGAK